MILSEVEGPDHQTLAYTVLMAGKQNIQSAKETSRRLALQLGLALERHGTRIETVSMDGERKVLVTAKATDQLWPAALEAIKNQLAGSDVDKSTVPSLSCDQIEIYADGGSRGNPGPSASAFVLYNAKTNQFLEEGGEFLGITTNNQAEYHALRLALERALAYKPKKVSVFMDSQLVVNQLNGIYRVKSRDLWPVFAAIKQLAATIGSVTYRHVPRGQNSAADSVVNKILDSN